MTQQNLDFGTAAANDGEFLGTAFLKIQENFDEIYAAPLSLFAPTTSAQLAGVITDETGSGALVFGTSPTLTTPALTTPTLTTSALLSSGFAFSWNSGDVTQTHSSNTMTWAGATSGYRFDTGISLGTAASQPFTVTPTGNAIDTLSSLTVQGGTASSTVREFLFNVGMNVTHSGSQSPTFSAHKVAGYFGITAQSGGGEPWAINTVTQLESGWGAGLLDAHGIEIDLNNLSGTHDDTFSDGNVVGLSISGASTSRSLTAIQISQNTAMWNYGIVIVNDAVRLASIYDDTDAVAWATVLGSRTTGLDLSGATFSGNAIKLGSGHVIDWNSDMNITHSADTLTINGGNVTLNGIFVTLGINNVGTTQTTALITAKSAELTIAGGVITVTGGYHDVDTQADDATDDLDTINGGSDGMIVTLRANNDARTVVVKDGTGNIQIAGDMTLDNRQDTITLIYDGTLTSWLERGRAASGA